MPAGFQCYNDIGYIQIIDDLKNFVMVGKGTVNLAVDGTTWAGSNVTCGSHAQITIANTLGYPPVLAIKCDVAIVVYRTRLVGSNWVTDLVAANNQSYTNTIYWYAFLPIPNVAPVNYGLEVRNAAGQLCYHSGYRPMSVKDRKTQAGGNAYGESVSLGAGKTAAVVITTHRWEWTQQFPSGAWVQYLSSTACVNTATDTVQIVNSQFGQMNNATNFGFGAGSNGSWSGLILDVTNY